MLLGVVFLALALAAWLGMVAWLLWIVATSPAWPGAVDEGGEDDGDTV